MEDMFRVGVYANTHGIKGEIKVFPTTEDIRRFDDLTTLYMDCRKQGMKELEVENVRYFKNMVILKFKGIDDINEIIKFKGADLYVSREDAIPLEDGEFYIADVLGARVVSDEGEELGILKEVMQTGANDVYIVDMNNGREALFPAIPDCIKDVDVENRLITVHVMKGLLD